MHHIVNHFLFRHNVVQTELSVYELPARKVFILMSSTSPLSRDRQMGPLWWQAKLPFSPQQTRDPTFPTLQLMMVQVESLKYSPVTRPKFKLQLQVTSIQSSAAFVMKVCRTKGGNACGAIASAKRVMVARECAPSRQTPVLIAGRICPSMTIGRVLLVHILLLQL